MPSYLRSDEELFGSDGSSGGNLGVAPPTKRTSSLLRSDDDLFGSSVESEIDPSVQPKRTILGTAGDVLNTGIKAAIAVPEFVVGLGDIASGGNVGKALENKDGALGMRFKQAREASDELFRSDAQAYADKQVQSADGFVDTVKAAVQNPSTILTTVGESLPSMLGGQVIAKGLMKAAPKLSRFMAAGAGEGAVSAGATAEGIRQQTEDGELTMGQSALAVGSGALTALLTFGGGKVAKRLGIEDVDQFFLGMGKGSPELKKGTIRRVLEGAVAEGVIEELPQSVQEQIAQNLALGKKWDEGVGSAAAMGMLAGGALGGGVQLLNRNQPATPTAEEPAADAAEKPARDGTAQAFVAQAFTDVGGAGTAVDEMMKARSFIANSLANMTEDEATQAIQAASGGDQTLAQAMMAARQDQELVAAGSPSTNTLDHQLVSHLLRSNAGLIEVNESTPSISQISAEISRYFPAFTQKAVEQYLPGIAGQMGQAAQQPAMPQQPPLNSAGFVPESLTQLQAQLSAVQQGRKPAAVIGMEEAQQLDLNGLAQGVAIDNETGAQSLVLARDDAAVQQIIARVDEVGFKTAMGEALGYAQPGLTDGTGAPTAVVQQVDNETGQVIQDELVTPDAAGTVKRIDGTTVRVLPVQQAFAERQAAAQSEQQQQPTAVVSPETTPNQGVQGTLFGRSEQQRSATAVPTQPTAVAGAPSKRTSALVRGINVGNNLQGDQAVDESSIVEVDLKTLTDKAKAKRLQQLVRAVKRATGVDLVLVQTPAGSLMRKNGEAFTAMNGVAAGNSVFMQLDAAAPLNTLGHEVTHVMETTMPEIYNKLQEVVLNRMQLGRALKLRDSLEAAINSESNGSADTERKVNEIRSELVAESVGELLDDPKAWAEIFAGTDESTAKKIYDAVMKILTDFAQAFTREGYIAGLKDMQVVRKAVTEAYLDWSRQLQMQEAQPKTAVAKTAVAQTAVAKPAAPKTPKFSRPDLARRISDGGETVTEAEIAADPGVSTLYNALKMRRAEADRLKSGFDAAVTAAAEATGSKPMLAKVKGMKRAFEKAWYDYHLQDGFPLSEAALKVKDLLRATVAFDNLSDAQAVIDSVVAQFPGATVKRNGYGPNAVLDKTGYRDIFFNVSYEGMNVEVQANLPPMLKAKEALHIEYEFTRSVDSQAPKFESSEEAIKQKYEAGWMPAMLRSKYLASVSKQRGGYMAAYFNILDSDSLPTEETSATNSDLVKPGQPSLEGRERDTVRTSVPFQRKQEKSEQTTGIPSSSLKNQSPNSVSSAGDSAADIALPPNNTSGYSNPEVTPQANGLTKFSRQSILAVANGNRIAPMEVLSAPTESMIKAGLDRRLPIRMEASVVLKLLTGKDNVRRQLTPDEILGLKARIQSPVAVFDDPTDKNSVVLMTDFLVDGDPIVVAINRTVIDKTYNVDNVDQLGRKIQGGTTEKAKFSPFKTAYGKDLMGLLNWLNKSRMVYFNPALSKKSLDVFLHNRLEEAATKSRAYKEKTEGPLGNTTSDSAPIASASSSGVESQPQPSASSIGLPAGSVNPATGRKTLGVKPKLQRVLGEGEEVPDDSVDASGTVSSYETKEFKDGSLMIYGDAEEIRALLPSSVLGKATADGLMVTGSMAPRAKAALAGESMLYGRAGKITDHNRYQTGERKGQYIGAPELYNTPAKITGLRKMFRQLAKEGVAGRFWYEDSGLAVLNYVGGNKEDARKFISLLAIYSPQAKVNANTTMALSAWSQYKAGLPIQTKTARQDAQAEDVLRNNKPWGGEKTNNFYKNLMREVDLAVGAGSMQGATIDMWMMRAAQYETDAPTPAQYKFVEIETNRLAKELGWEPQQVQAAIWTSIKARTENKQVKKDTEAESVRKGFMRYGEGKVGKNGKASQVRVLIDPVAHRALWFKTAFAYKLQSGDISTAAYHFGTALAERSAQLSYEATPGKSTGILPGIHTAPVEQQREYLRDMRQALTDEQGRDIIDARIGLMANAGPEGNSGWDGEASVGVQNNAPVYTKDGRVSDNSRNLIELSLAVRGLALKQEGMAWHFPLWRGSKYGQNGIEFDLGRSLNYQETAVLYAAITKELGNSFSPPIPTRTGFRVLNFPDAKFALMDEKLTDEERKPLVKDSTKANKAFHEAINRAVSQQAWAAEVSPAALFESDGDLLSNNWENGDGDYRRTIQEKLGSLERGDADSGTRRSDLQGWIDSVLVPKVTAVNERFAEKYGWDNPSRVNFNRAGLEQPAGGSNLGRGESAGQVRGAIHYGKSAFLSQLSGGASGQGIRGAEQERLSEKGTDPRIKRRVYFYLPVAGGIPQPEIGLGAHVYTTDLDRLFDPTQMPPIKGSGNALESAILDAGYRGYINREQGTVVVLNEDVPVQYTGTRDGKVVVPRRIERIVPQVATRTEGNETVRRMDNPIGLQAKEAAIAAAPSFRLQFGEARVATDEKDAANAALETAGSAFKFSRALDMAREMNTYDGKRLSSEGIPQPMGTPITELFSNFGNAKITATNWWDKTGRGRTQAEAEAEQFDDFRGKMFDRANGEDFKYTDTVEGDTAVGEGTVSIRASKISGSVRVQFKNKNGVIIAAARLDKGKIDSIGVPLKFAGKGVGPAVLVWMKQQGIANIAQVPDRSPGFVKAQKEAFTRLGSNVSFSRAPAVNSEAFKKWFGNSTVVNADGTPKVMYHGTARNISAFRAKQAGAIFVTDSPEFAAGFSSMSEEYMQKNGLDALTPEQRTAVFNEVEKRIKSEYPKDRAVRESLTMKLDDWMSNGYTAEGELLDYIRESAGQFLDSGQNIMPLYVSAQNPFDYGNPAHLSALAKELGIPPNDWRMLDIKRGQWSDIEAEDAQAAIKALGHDAFYVMEGGVKNLAVYKPEQLKSVTGNSGLYSAENPDIRFSRTDTPAFRKWFGDSKVVDAEGRPMVVYHSTYSDIADFKTSFGDDEYRRFGVHVGTLEAAQNRIDVKAAEDTANRERSGNAGVNMMLLYVRSVQPLRLAENRSGRWGVDDIMQAIVDKVEADQMPVLSQEFVDSFYEDDTRIEYAAGLRKSPKGGRRWQDVGEWVPGERSRLLKSWLKALGYDSIVYKNDFEGGGDSYILFDSEQIKSATGNNGDFDGSNPDIRFSRPTKPLSVQQMLAMTAAGKVDYTLGEALDRGQWADAYMGVKDKTQRSELLGAIGDWAIKTFADSMIPVKRWLDATPMPASLRQRVTGDLYRAATLRGAMQKEVKDKFTDPMFRSMEKAAKASGKTSDEVKMLAGQWMTATYVPKANAHLIGKDRAALIVAQQSGDAAAIAAAQKNLADRIADVNGVIGQAKTRGVGGGMNNAEAAQAVANAEMYLDRATLKGIAGHVYDMLAWKKAKDLQSGRVSQMMVNSWPNHRDYVPLTGDPRYTPESNDVFSAGGQINQDADKAMNGRKDSIADDAFDAAFTAVVKSINSSGMQGFKRGLNKIYMEAQITGANIGMTREPVTGIMRNTDDLVIYRDNITLPNGLQTTAVHAFRFSNPAVIEALKREHEEQLNSLLGLIATPTRWYGRLVTQMMPMFAPVNLIRDVWERSELIRTRTLLDRNGNKIDTDKVARKAIADSVNPALWRGTFAENWNLRTNNQQRADLKEMIELGGSSTWGDYLSRSAQDLEADIRGSFGKVAATARTANTYLEAYNNSFEMIAPLAIYRALKAANMTKEDAAAATLDLMNFKKKGAAMPAIRALYVFAQPAATSGYNLMQYLSTTKGKKRFAAQALVGYMLYTFLRGMWGDDEDDEEVGNKLDNLSNFTVERSIPIPFGDKVVKVPVGFGPPQLAWATAGIFSRYMNGRYEGTTAVGEAAKAWVKSFSPVAPSDMEITKRPVDWMTMTFTPTVLRPLMSIATDQTSFGSPLTPQFQNPDKYKSEQARRTTAPLYSDIAQEIREITGQDVYPDHVKALMDGYLIGPMREFTKALVENPAKEARGEPGSVSLVAQMVDNVNDRQLLNTVYYRMKDDLLEVNKEYESRLREGTLGEWLDGEKMQQVIAYKKLEKVERTMGQMRGTLTKQRDMLDPDDLAARVQAVEERVDAARRQAIVANK